METLAERKALMDAPNAAEILDRYAASLDFCSWCGDQMSARDYDDSMDTGKRFCSEACWLSYGGSL